MSGSNDWMSLAQDVTDMCLSKMVFIHIYDKNRIYSRNMS